jgi:predicted ATPase/class 3 adenylate cyclase
MRELPRGTVTMLFTDIQGSTRLLQQLGRENYVEALQAHRRLLREALTAHGGVEVEMQGDSFHFAFPTARGAVAAAAAGQRALAAHEWADEPIRVRMGVHTGEPVVTGGLYAGLDVHRAARVMSAAHGGQILLSARTADLIGEQPPEGFSVRDLGEHRLKDLLEPQRLFQLVGDSLEDDFPPPKTLESRRTNLPVQPTPLVGREREVTEVLALLRRDDVRLLTLTGPGGTGKTRLALQGAVELVEAFGAGVYFVNLAALTDPELVLPTIAQTLGLKEQAGESIVETIAAYLGATKLLLVLDNFEQVAEGASAVGELIARAPNLKTLVTSRASLHLSAEYEYAVPPLAEDEAVALFTDRAQAAKPSFSLDGNRPVVAEICHKLDNLPLAIELAAARIKLLPEQSLLERLDERLKILTGGARDVDERQRTLRATIDWSYDLLTDDEKRLFIRLAVFAGGRTLEAIEAVCNAKGDLDVFEGIASLVDKSLLRQEEGPDGQPRFVMLETVHEYAGERLRASGAESELRARHLDYFRRVAENADSRLRGKGQGTAMKELAAEQDNVRAALGAALELGREDAALALACASALFWETHGQFREARRWFDAVLAADRGSAPQTRARVLFWAGYLSVLQAEWVRAAGLLTEARRLALEVDDGSTLALVLGKQAWVAAETGDVDAARRLAEEGLALASRVGDAWTRAELLNDAGVANERADPERTVQLFGESLELRRELGGEFDIADSLNNLGYALAHQGQAERARALLDEGLVIAERTGDLRHVALIHGNFGLVDLFRGSPEDAHRHFAECLRVSRRIGDQRVPFEAIRGIAAVAAFRGDLQEAACLAGAVDALYRASGGTPTSAESKMEERFIAPLRDATDHEAWALAATRGETMTLADAITEALGDELAVET